MEKQFKLVFDNGLRAKVVFTGSRKACIWQAFQHKYIMKDANGKIIPHYSLAEDEVARILPV